MNDNDTRTNGLESCSSVIIVDLEKELAYKVSLLQNRKLTIEN